MVNLSQGVHPQLLEEEEEEEVRETAKDFQLTMKLRYNTKVILKALDLEAFSLRSKCIWVSWLILQLILLLLPLISLGLLCFWNLVIFWMFKSNASNSFNFFAFVQFSKLVLLLLVFLNFWNGDISLLFAFEALLSPKFVRQPIISNISFTSSLICQWLLYCWKLSSIFYRIVKKRCFSRHNYGMFYRILMNKLKKKITQSTLFLRILILKKSSYAYACYGQK